MKIQLQAFGFRLQRTLLDIPRGLLLRLLRAYKLGISPLFPPACRYVPTCSEYAAEAVERYGVIRGIVLAAWRLLRCHPFAQGGFDPLPDLGPQMNGPVGPHTLDKDAHGYTSMPVH